MIVVKLTPLWCETIRELDECTSFEDVTNRLREGGSGSQLAHLAVNLAAAGLRREASLIAILSRLAAESPSEELVADSDELLPKKEDWPKEWDYLLPDLLRRYPNLPYWAHVHRATTAPYPTQPHKLEPPPVLGQGCRFFFKGSAKHRYVARRHGVKASADY